MPRVMCEEEPYMSLESNCGPPYLIEDPTAGQKNKMQIYGFI